jgi:hypothetical protein
VLSAILFKSAGGIGAAGGVHIMGRMSREDATVPLATYQLSFVFCTSDPELREPNHSSLQGGL